MSALPSNVDDGQNLNGVRAPGSAELEALALRRQELVLKFLDQPTAPTFIELVREAPDVASALLLQIEEQAKRLNDQTSIRFMQALKSLRSANGVNPQPIETIEKSTNMNTCSEGAD